MKDGSKCERDPLSNMASMGSLMGRCEGGGQFGLGRKRTEKYDAALLVPLAFDAENSTHLPSWEVRLRILVESLRALQ